MTRFAFATAAFCFALVGFVAAQDVLTNEGVRKLVKAGVSEETIVNMVQTQPTNFSVGVEQVLALKGSGVSPKIIDAMVLRSNSVNASPNPTAGEQPKISRPDGYPAEGGVFYRSSTGWVRIEDANPQSKTKGMIGMVINPLGKMSSKWTFDGKAAPLKIANSQPEFCLVDYNTPRAVKVVALGTC